ncbi:hypothetical protein D9M72_494160 [compost metagenome]
MAVDEHHCGGRSVSWLSFTGNDRVALNEPVALEPFDTLAHGIPREVDLIRQFRVRNPRVAGQLGKNMLVQAVEDAFHGCIS